MHFDKHVLEIDARAEAERLSGLLLETVRRRLRKNGAVVGISGGVDSSVVLALCVGGLGPGRVRPLILPDTDSDPESERLARMVARRYGVEPVLESISENLQGFGCYRRRDDAIRRVFPEFDAAQGYKAKISLPPNLLDEGTLNVFSLTIIRPDGKPETKPLPPQEFRQIVAASNFKQRSRMAMLYYHAELNNYAVVGTANKNEHDMGFFVKHGDAGVDVQPITHLYKTQVYRLAEFLDVPEEIRRRPPTSDTYSAPSTQQEFFFRLPFETLDLLWYAMERRVPVAEVAAAMQLSEAQVSRAYDDFSSKRRSTEYLRVAPVAFEPEAWKVHRGAEPAAAR